MIREAVGRKNLVENNREFLEVANEEEFQVPIVSFDVSLGKKYKYVDFDYGEYERTTSDMDGTLEDFEGAKIKVKMPNRILRGTFGTLDGEIQTMRGEGVNETFAHENQHYIDHSKGLYSFREVAIANIAALAKAATLGAILADFALREMTSGEVHNIAKTSTLPVAGAYLGSWAVRFIYYQVSPNERRARKAAQRYGNRKIIILELQ